MIEGVNDSPREARQLADLVKGTLSHVNLIPINPVPERGLKPSAPAVVQRFQTIVAERGVPSTIRKEMGGDIDAACGQLRWRALAAGDMVDTAETGGRTDGKSSGPQRRGAGPQGQRR
jgi:23S rRNA (adenine2503-C2)-methyltransferase